MPSGARQHGGSSTKGNHHVATTCTDDRGHDPGRVSCWNAAGLRPGGLPTGGALSPFAGPAQRGGSTGLPARLAPERRGPRHVQNQPVWAAVPVSSYAWPRLGVVREKKIACPRQKRLPEALSDDQVRHLLGCVRSPIHRTCLAIMLARKFPSGVFCFRLMVLMQACAMEGGH